MFDPSKICLKCMSPLTEAGSVCSVCGTDNSELQNQQHQLPVGSILAGNYLVGCALGQGGFGVTYIGWDLVFDQKVAIKEYYPDGCVSREMSTHSTVVPMLGDKGEFFTRGKQKFVEEARILARFSDDPCIVNVRRFFQENGTAYIAMDFAEGKTLKAYAKDFGGKLPANELLALLRPLMESLSRVHDAGLLHRDIAPDNIMLQPDGGIKLLDFGAARQISAMGEKSLTINVKHGFAPEEQYRTHGEQGPWTDLYALCATIYYLTTGKLPPQAMDRLADNVPIAAPTGLGADFTPAQEQAILKGLSVRGRDRQQSMKEFMDELDRTEVAAPPPVPVPPKKKSKFFQILVIAVAAAGLLAAALFVFILPAIRGSETGTLTAAASTPESVVTPDKLEELYSAAQALLDGGRYEEAARAFARLGSYRGALKTAWSIRYQYLHDGDIDAGLEHTVGLHADGTVTAVGNNSDGQCNVFGWTDIVAVSASYLHTVGLRADGTVAAVGYNAFGQCGVSDWTNIVAMSAGWRHTVGLRADGTVTAVGSNSTGQCNVSDWTDIVAVSAGNGHTVGLRADGTVVAVGYKENGQCNVSGWTDIVTVSAGSWDTVGLHADGTVIAIGSNEGGQCDVSGWTDIVAVSAGDRHTVGLRADGTVVAVGNNDDGQCNVSDWTDIVAVAIGDRFTVGLRADGRIEAAGYVRGEPKHNLTDIGCALTLEGVDASDGSVELMTTPDTQEELYSAAQTLLDGGHYEEAARAFARLGSYRDALKTAWAIRYQYLHDGDVATGWYHTAGLHADGTVVAIGDNEYGQCNVFGWRDIVAVSTGGSHTAGLRADGTVTAVGTNEYGQCNVSDWTDIVAVSTGWSHTVGLRADGTVVVVGDNTNGQCNVSGWKNIVAVSAGGEHTVGLRADGTVTAVGSNEYGQCDVSDWTDIVAVLTCSLHTVGLHTNGTVVAIGDNAYGQCEVSDWMDITSVSTGEMHTVGQRADGTLVAVGDNEYGQCNVLNWTDIVAVTAAGGHTIGLHPDGKIDAVGDTAGESKTKLAGVGCTLTLDGADAEGAPLDGSAVPLAFTENGYTATLLWHDDRVTVSLTCPELPEEYTVNTNNQNALDSAWQVFFTVDGHEYHAAIMHFSTGGVQETIPLTQMQSDLWEEIADEPGSFTSIMDISVTIEGNTLTWVFTPPDKALWREAWENGAIVITSATSYS